MLDRKC